jgi:hypothetical protein
MARSSSASRYRPERKQDGFVTRTCGPASATFAIDGEQFVVFADDAHDVRRLLSGYIAHARRLPDA